MIDTTELLAALDHLESVSGSTETEMGAIFERQAKLLVARHAPTIRALIAESASQEKEIAEADRGQDGNMELVRRLLGRRDVHSVYEGIECLGRESVALREKLRAAKTAPHAAGCNACWDNPELRGDPLPDTCNCWKAAL